MNTITKNIYSDELVTIGEGVSFARTGYTLDKYTTNANGTGTSYAINSQTRFNSNTTLYAFWSLAQYNIDYNMNGHGTNPNTKTTYTIEENFTPSNPTNPTGYTFSGWTPANITKGSTENKTFTANWLPTTYTISYNMNEIGTNPSGNPTSYTIESSTITPAAPSNTDLYSFTGWTPPSIPHGSWGNKEFIANWTQTAWYYRDEKSFTYLHSQQTPLTEIYQRTVDSIYGANGFDEHYIYYTNSKYDMIADWGVRRYIKISYTNRIARSPKSKTTYSYFKIVMRVKGSGTEIETVKLMTDILKVTSFNTGLNDANGVANVDSDAANKGSGDSGWIDLTSLTSGQYGLAINESTKKIYPTYRGNDISNKCSLHLYFVSENSTDAAGGGENCIYGLSIITKESI